MEGSPARRDHFKSSVSGVAGQRRRKLAVTLGKERRAAAVRAKRIRRAEDDTDIMEVAEDDEVARSALEENTKVAIQELKSACKDISRGANHRKLEALKKVRRLLSCSSLPPVDVAVEAGVVPILVDCLGFGSSEEQLLEAAWCLTNIASGDVEQTRAIISAVPLLIAHLGERSPAPVVEQCAWALGNVAGDSEDLREILLAQGALRPLGRLILSTRPTLARTACWVLSNLIKGPSPKAVSDLMKTDGILEGLLRHLEKGDEALAAEAAWVLVYISSLSDTRPLINAGLLPPLVRWLATSHQLVVLTPVLRTIGNIVTGDSTKTDAVIFAGSTVPGGVMGALARCLQNDNRTLQKEGAWVISNIAAGSLQHKELVFTVATRPLVHLLATATFDVRKEAAYALGNLCVAPKEIGKVPQPILQHLVALVDVGCIAEFVNLVKLPDVEAAKLGFQFLELVMRGLPAGAKLVEKCDGMAGIEMLQFHENEELRNMANQLMDTYFGDDYGLEEEYGPGAMDGLRGDQDPSTEYPAWRKGGMKNV